VFFSGGGVRGSFGGGGGGGGAWNFLSISVKDETILLVLPHPRSWSLVLHGPFVTWVEIHNVRSGYPSLSLKFYFCGALHSPRTEDEQGATSQARQTVQFYGNTRAFSTSSPDELFCCVSTPHASTLCLWTELRSYGSVGEDGRNFPFALKGLLQINNTLSIMSEKRDVLFGRESMVGKYFIIELQKCGRMDTWNRHR